MLREMRQHVRDLLAPVKTATLSTTGPAGIQAHPFPCEPSDIHLFLLLPEVSDHLLNLEFDPTAVASTNLWVLRGAGHVLPLSAAPKGLLLPHAEAAADCVLLEIIPAQMQVYRPDGWGFMETIDIDPDIEPDL